MHESPSADNSPSIAEDAPLAIQLAAPIAAPEASGPAYYDYGPISVPALAPGYDPCANYYVDDYEQQTDFPTLLEYFNEAVNVSPSNATSRVDRCVLAQAHMPTTLTSNGICSAGQFIRMLCRLCSELQYHLQR